MQFVIGLMLGLKLGVSIGLLTAPQTGSETVGSYASGFNSEARRTPAGTIRRPPNTRSLAGR